MTKKSAPQHYCFRKKRPFFPRRDRVRVRGSLYSALIEALISRHVDTANLRQAELLEKVRVGFTA